MNVHASEFTLLTESAASLGIPKHMRQGLVMYCLMGLAPGEFLQRVIQNDLNGAFQYADYLNQPILHRYAEFFLLHAPDGCYGSREAYEQWLKQKGKAGATSSTSGPGSGSN